MSATTIEFYNDSKSSNPDKRKIGKQFLDYL